MKIIAHITDAHLDEPSPEGLSLDPDGNWTRVLRDLKLRQIDEIVFGGDIGASSSHERFFNTLAEQKRPTRLVLGNHDVCSEVRKFYTRTAVDNELYDAADTSRLWRTIFLDSSTGEIGTAQLKWLDVQLNESGAVLIFIHHPILQVETAVDVAYPLRNRDVVRARLLAHPHSVILVCGHYHMADERVDRNVRQITTPAVSFQCKKESKDTVQFDNSSFGYRLIYFDDSALSSEVIRLERSEGVQKCVTS